MENCKKQEKEKKKKKKEESFFKDEEFPPLPKSSSAEEYQTSSKTIEKEHQVKCKRKIIHLMKEPRHVLLSKEYQKKEVKKEDDYIEEIIQKIENEHISTFHGMGNRTTSFEYSLDSSSWFNLHMILWLNQRLIIIFKSEDGDSQGDF